MIILDRADIEASVDAWAKGSKSGRFNDAAASGETTPRRVDMTPVNDRQPGILGLR